MEIGRHHRSWLCTLGSRWLSSYLHHTDFRQGSGQSGFALEGTLWPQRGDWLSGDRSKMPSRDGVTALVHVGEMGFGPVWASGWI